MLNLTLYLCLSSRWLGWSKPWLWPCLLRQFGGVGRGSEGSKTNGQNGLVFMGANHGPWARSKQTYRSMHGCHQDRIFETERISPAVFALASTHADALKQQNQNVLDGVFTRNNTSFSQKASNSEWWQCCNACCHIMICNYRWILAKSKTTCSLSYTLLKN